ncbi:MAG: hypothetical protein V4653_15390 [Pseudomonadota bacterium]
MEGFDAAGAVAPAELPAGSSEAFLATRPVLVARGEPGPVVILLDFDARGIGG